MINTTRLQQFILQAYLFNKGCEITMYNLESRMTLTTKEALSDLVEKKVLSYSRNGKAETFVTLLGRKDVEHGERFTQDDGEYQMTSADINYTPLFKLKKIN